MQFSVWIISGLLLSGAPLGVQALAAVESRTGERVVRPSMPIGIDQQEPQAPQGERQRYTQIEDPALRTLKQLEGLKQEISELRGLVETQDHAIQQLKKSQQDLYLDLDKRLTVLQQAQVPQKEKRSASASSAVEPKHTVALKQTSVIPKPSATVETSAMFLPPHTGEAVDALMTTSAPEISRLSATMALDKKSGSVTEKDAYEAAYNLVRSKQYSEAITAFHDYLTRFKEGEYAANANYWLGEIYMTQWNADKTHMEKLDKAITAFSNITTQFPKHAKVADALLKLGLIESEKGNVEAAKKYFTEVKRRFPGSAAARIADSRLKQ